MTDIRKRLLRLALVLLAPAFSAACTHQLSTAAVHQASPTASLTLSDSYQYDAFGRLTKVTYPDGSSVSYAYDNAGNRVTVSKTGP